MSYFSRARSSQGFTLIEVMIAIGILSMGIGAILVAENNSLDVTIRAKRMTTVAMLAKNTLIQAEREIEGKTFDETKEESTGKFEAPFADYTWERKIKKIEFPNLLGQPNAEDAKSGEATVSDPNVDRVVKLATNFLSKASREVVITIKWKEKGQDQSFAVSQYWVDLKHEFSMTEGP